ncbi:MAG: NAD(P)-dependent oxidoreductase [Halobacteriales archaeon]|nr:NAD(P)-dependent oxidoreductase [Halobacteriales archaeon]
MDTVLVTGGRGQSGRWIVDRLAEKYQVVCLDRDHPGFGVMGRDGIEFRAADLADGEAAFDLITELDPDAVVHWAAIPAAGRHASSELFATNTQAAYNTLTAAGRVGADIVQASSDGIYGFFFADPTPMPVELPVTESHPKWPEDPYGLSKVTAEEIASGVVRRHGVSAVSIRPSWIQYPGAYPCRDPGYVENLDAGAGNFWSYVDVRDVVSMVEAALEADIEGHEAFNCVAADNALGRPLVELFEEYYGTVPADAAIEDDASVYAIEKAKTQLGWSPSHSWRTAADEAVSEPTLTI